MKRHVRGIWSVWIAVLGLGCGTDPGGSPDPGDGPTDPPAQRAAWTWANPLPQGNFLHRAFFADANTVYSVGTGGSVIKSTDAGSTWEVLYNAYQVQPSFDVNFYDLFFVDAQCGWVVGTLGSVHVTTDGGGTWSDRSVATSMTLRGVCFVSATTGVVVGDGGEIHRTTDGGVSWTPVANPDAGDNRLNAVDFFDANAGFAVGRDRTVLHTSDGGASWSELTVSGNSTELNDVSATSATGAVATGTDGTLRGGTLTSSIWSSGVLPGATWAGAVHFETSQVGLVLGSSVAGGAVTYTTTDGGFNWQTSSVTSDFAVQDLVAHGSVWLVVGEDGGMRRSANAGGTWTSIHSGAKNQFWDVSFGTADRGIAVGDGGTVLVTNDGGASWQGGSSGTTETLRGAWMVDGSMAMAVGDCHTAIVSQDGGATWTDMTLPSLAEFVRLESVGMWDASSGLIVGSLDDGEETLLRTGDGGATWQKLSRGSPPNFRFLDVHTLPGTSIATIVGTGGAVFRTTDGGGTWTRQGQGVTNAELWGVHFIDANTGWIAAFATHVLRTTDGGATWSRVNLATNLISNVFFVDALVGYLSVNVGAVYKSNDGGLSWAESQAGIGGDAHMRSVWATSTTHAVVVGAEGVIKFTETGGLAP